MYKAAAGKKKSAKSTIKLKLKATGSHALRILNKLGAAQDKLNA